MKTLYLIPARGGSKGIPRKNIKDFAGKPLIAHAISHALEAGADKTDICVSTDSEEIAEVARNAGASVPFIRPAEFSGDTASSRDVMIHALDWYESHGVHYERLVLLQPTSPLRTAADITSAIALFDATPGADMAVSVAEVDANPYYNAFEADGEGYLHLSKGDGGITRRQDAPKVWRYTGAVYVIDTESLRRSPLSKMKKIVGCEMPASRAVDLDTPDDWLLAEFLYTKINQPICQQPIPTPSKE